MNAALAIYEALLQANVPAPAARGVAEALEKDTTSLLATKQDLQQLELRIEHRLQVVTAKLQSLEEHVDLKLQAMDLKLQGLEARLVIKLGILMSVLFSLAGGIVALLR